MTTTVLHTRPDDVRDQTVERAAALLRDGGLVALPTETVYGLAASATHPQAVRRLTELKERAGNKPFPVVFATPEAALKRASSLTPAARRLAARFWPGPLTLVVDDGSDGTIGVRVPGNEVTRSILAASNEPVLLPSANPADAAPPRTVEEVLAHFDGRIDAVVDDGEAPLGVGSTVVRVAGGSLDILRAGILTEQQIRDAAIVSILLVCTGNTCRSPMAQALLRDALSRRFNVETSALEDLGYRVSSAGIAAGNGSPASAGAREVMARREISLTGHQSTQLTRELLDRQSLVLAMTRGHLERIVAMTSHPERCFLLATDDVVDPFGGSDAVYETCAREIEVHVSKLAERL